MKPTPTTEELLSFEFWVRNGGMLQRQKVRRIRERWGWSESRYIAELGRAIDTDEALAHMPAFTRTLRRERDERRAIRTGPTSRQSAPGPDPRQTTLADITPRRDGEREKQVGVARANGAASPPWKAAWDGAIEKLAAAGEPFTSDDVRVIAGGPTDHPNAAGARFLAASRRGLIRSVGYRPSDRASLHRHPLTLWVGADVREGVA